MEPSGARQVFSLSVWQIHNSKTQIFNIYKADSILIHKQLSLKITEKNVEKKPMRSFWPNLC